MSTELAVQEQRPLSVVPKYSTEQVQLLADTIARGCDESEMRLFLEVSKFTRLNPFTGQIRPVKRWDRNLGREAMVIQVGIDGYRSIASRTGDLAGIDDAIYDSEGEASPNWAKVTVYRWSHGEKIPFTATARWKEYVQTKKGGEVNSMWSRMPYLMLAKCAEALALRKAFPDELSGMYTEEEMGQADNPEPTDKPQVVQPTRASERKAQPQASEKYPEQNGNAKPEPEKISGVIESLKEGGRGSIWVSLAKKLVAIEEKFVDDGMKMGAKLTVMAIRKSSEKLPEYYAVTSVLDDGEGSGGGGGSPVLEGELVDQLDAAMNDTQPELNLADLMQEGQVQKASDLPAGTGGKKIGSSRAQRLYAYLNQNKKTTGFSEEKLKEIIAQAPLNLTSLSDLPIDWQERIEKICKGEDDWRKYLEGEGNDS